VFHTSKLIATLAVAGIVPAVAAQAADTPDAGGKQRAVKLELLERPGHRLERSIDVHETLLERRQRRREAREAREPDFVAPEHYGVSQGTLDSIGACESGGDPTAVSSDGTYRGKYQFDTGTWSSVGGSGDPAAAPEAEQDMRAAMLYSQSGSSPWPICGS
jgi:hypothetical protein